MTTLVFDNTALNHFAKAGRLTELGAIVDGYHCVAPAEVFAELTKAVAEYPALGTISAQGWLSSVELGETAEIVAFAQYKHELGGGSDRNVGESAVLALVAVNGGIAIIDETTSLILVCGSQWQVARPFSRGLIRKVCCHRRSHP